MNNLYSEAVKDEDFQSAIANYVLGAKGFLPDEAQFFCDFLSRFSTGSNATLISHALESLSTVTKASYIYLEGSETSSKR